MSEYKLVSPLLDGFVMGDPISSHDGISCCPAIRENSEEKYIVKIISVPANQKQLDALLLTGAYPDAASATDYFKEVAEEISKEAELLKQLAKLEGFLGYEDWQILPMEGSRLGYQIYLLSPYRRSLEKYLQRHTMTHLGAVNLALDLCAALSVCRRAGYMHLDLKPSNIFISGKREFRIGDLGFVKLNALKYTSLPEKYTSSYTPPELKNLLATLNPTADIYAVGMILYQIYNNGLLPDVEKASLAQLPPPLNADYELAEIILKACDPNPRKRWQTPIEMGQALASYMQRNSINDVPIVPPTVESDFLDAAYEPADEHAASESVSAEESEATGEIAAQSENMNFLQELVSDETAPDTEDAESIDTAALSDEVSAILSLADDLILDPSVESETETTPEPKSVSKEESDKPPVSDENSLLSELLQEPPHAETAPNSEPESLQEDEPFQACEEPRKKRGWIKTLIGLMILALICAAGFFFYQNYYLLTIADMDIISVEDRICVKLVTEADEALLTVTCTDAYGNSISSNVSNSEAVFTNVTPSTLYRITVSTEGFHKVSGASSGTVTTVAQAKITGFTAKTGTEDGSAVLSFSVDGPEQDWILEYCTEDEEPRSLSFTGHMVTVNNLTVGKTYTFTLKTESGVDLFITGTASLEYTASNNVFAEDLKVLSCQDGVLSVVWKTPADTSVEQWTVRCYSENGFDETVTVSETAASFEGISPDAAYTIDVTAIGMSQSSRTYVSTNPVTISDILVDDSTAGTLAISWNSNNTIPEGGWLLLYRLDTTDSSLMVRCEENSAIIENIVPGADYHLSIQAANGVSVFSGTHTYEGKPAAAFKDHDLDASKISASLCPTPEITDWTYKDIADDAYTSTYAIGSKVSIVLYSPDKPDNTGRETAVMFVIRDSDGNVIPELTKSMVTPWREMWKNRSRYCELNLPIIPNVAGQYTVQVYFNQALVVEKVLNITE